MQPLSGIICCAALLLFAEPVFGSDSAADGSSSADWGLEGWGLQVSVYTTHFDPEPDHVNDQKLISLETFFNNGWLAGLAVFDNSFGQDSQYLYMGRSWQLVDSEFWYFKLTGGLLHGYKEPYEDKIPLNGVGIAPAIVPALGFRYRRLVAEAHLAGLAALTLTVGVRF